MTYEGTELELFQHATNWKRYWAAQVGAFVSGRVLDVGCGFGVNAGYLANDRVTSYTFLEPDQELLAQVVDRSGLPTSIPSHRIHGTTETVVGSRFDTLLYIDVLEHIADPSAELQRAASLLDAGGHLIIVVPAFQFLYSPFDKAIGHHRRYTRTMLREQIPAGFKEVNLRYFDSAGLLLSLGNKMLLRRVAPTAAQIAFWDRYIVPCSRITDRITMNCLGRSLVAVYQKV